MRLPGAPFLYQIAAQIMFQKSVTPSPINWHRYVTSTARALPGFQLFVNISRTTTQYEKVLQEVLPVESGIQILCFRAMKKDMQSIV